MQTLTTLFAAAEPTGSSGMETVTAILSIVIYGALAMIALWGAFCVIFVWLRVARIRFRNEEEQDEFLDALDEKIKEGDLESISEMCDNDERAMSQLALLAIVSRQLGRAKVRVLVADRFQRDVLADLEHRLSWVSAVIKTAPMVGLFGTVLGMMGAFAQLADPTKQPEPAALANNIMLALITTACGLAIAIPLVLSMASISVRIRKMEDLVGAGLARFFETFKAVTSLPETAEEE